MRKSTNRNNSTLDSSTENGVKLNDLSKKVDTSSLELEPVDDQIVNMRARVRSGNKNPTLTPPSPNTEASEYEQEPDEDQIADFEDLIDEYGAGELTCWVYRYDTATRGKPAYSCRFPFHPLTVLPTLQDQNPEGGKFKIRILDENGKFIRGFTVNVDPSVAHRKPNPQIFNQQAMQQQQVDPMAFMKPMLEMQGVMFGQMQTVMQLNSTMMTGLMAQMKSLTEIRPETQSPTAMLKEVMGLFSQVKEAQTTIGGVPAADGERNTPYTGTDILWNIFDKPGVAERLVNVVERVAGVTTPPVHPQSKQVDGELVEGDEDEPEETKGDGTIPNEEALNDAQKEAAAVMGTLVNDWMTNADPAPSAKLVKAYVVKYRADPAVGQIPLLLMLPPEAALQQLRSKLLLEEGYQALLKNNPNHLAWLTRFMELAK